jgi:hypothetical protein
MTKGREYLITGVFGTAQSAATAARALREAGFVRSQIAPLEREDFSAIILARGIRGFFAGAVLGALLGIGFEGTMLAFPGQGPFGSGGWLAASAAGAITGGFAGALVRSGLAQMAAERTAGRLADAAALTVRARDRFGLERARSVMRQVGAIETRAPIEDEESQVFAGGFAEVAPVLKDRWRDRYAGRDARWEDHERRYRYGWQIALRPDFAGRVWSEAEGDVAREWETRHPSVSWEQVREQVAEGWRIARAREDG